MPLELPAAARGALLRAAGGSRAARPLTSALSLAEGARVLLLRPDHLGDVLFVGPALARLRRSRPDLDLTLAVGPWSDEVARLLPGAPNVRLVSFPWYDRKPKPAVWISYAKLVTIGRALRRERYAAALVLRDDDWWSAWLARVARIPLRLGHDDRTVRRFLTHVLELPPTHTAARNIALTGALVGDNRPASPATDPLLLASLPAASAPELVDSAIGTWVGVHAGSGAAIKRWTPSAWRALAVALPDAWRWVLTGSSQESSLVRDVSDALPGAPVDLSGRTNLSELATVFRSCAVVIGPDSGPLHLAVAAGVPTVHLFGPAAADRFGPWGDPARHRVVTANAPCAPCGRLEWPDARDHPCVRMISPESVAEAVRLAVSAPV